jgi:hypothetical protein
MTLTHFSAEDLESAQAIPEVLAAAKKLERTYSVAEMQHRLQVLDVWTCLKGSIYARKQYVAIRLALVEYLLAL